MRFERRFIARVYDPLSATPVHDHPRQPQTPSVILIANVYLLSRVTLPICADPKSTGQTGDAVTGSRFPTSRRSGGLPAVATFKGRKVFAVSTPRARRSPRLFYIPRRQSINVREKTRSPGDSLPPLRAAALLLPLSFSSASSPVSFPTFPRCPLSGAAVAADGNPATRSARSQAIGGSGQHSLPATFRYDRRKVNCRRARAAWE